MSSLEQILANAGLKADWCLQTNVKKHISILERDFHNALNIARYTFICSTCIEWLLQNSYLLTSWWLKLLVCSLSFSFSYVFISYFVTLCLCVTVCCSLIYFIFSLSGSRSVDLKTYVHALCLFPSSLHIICSALMCPCFVYLLPVYLSIYLLIYVYMLIGLSSSFSWVCCYFSH